jgi:AraC-like DNA-binding protein
VARNLVGILPPMLYIQGSDEPRASWMQGVFRLMAAEARAFQPGGEAVITRLADVLVIQAIRAWIETAPAARTGWLGALQDPQIGQALTLIHRNPTRPWTVASLAHELAMSRSAFAARFTQLVDQPAMQYLTRWRMQLAQHALETEGTTVAELATRLGYQSEAAFARAFKRVMGVAPGAVKRSSQVQLATPLAVAAS